jgi:two-component system, LytTR family, sensor kinase
MRQLSMDIRIQHGAAGRSHPRTRGWIVIFLGCTLGAVLIASVMYVLMDVLEHVKPKPHLLFLWWLTRLYLFAALAPVVAVLLKRFPLHPASLARISLHFAASLVFAVVHLGLHLASASLILGQATLPGGSSSVFQQAIHNYPLGVVAYWIIVAIVSAANYYEQYGREQLRTSVLQAQLAEARLHALQMQLQPHFVFNALHSLSDLVTNDPKAAVRLIARLGDFLRLTLQNSNMQCVPLKQELAFLKAYLEIERVRFGDRLTITLEIDPESLDAEVPNLILQPLVENAIRHGVASHIGPGLVQVITKRQSERLQLAICDSGPGLAAGVRLGIGLKNTQERLQQAYGSNYSLSVRNHERGVLVDCEFPYRRFHNEERTAT